MKYCKMLLNVHVDICYQNIYLSPHVDGNILKIFTQTENNVWSKCDKRT